LRSAVTNELRELEHGWVDVAAAAAEDGQQWPVAQSIKEK